MNRATSVPARWPVTEPVSGVTTVPKPPLYKPALAPVVNFVGEIAEVDSARSACRCRYLQAVEDVGELHANVQTLAFLNPEVAAEGGVLHGSGSARGGKFFSEECSWRSGAGRRVVFPDVFGAREVYFARP